MEVAKGLDGLEAPLVDEREQVVDAQWAHVQIKGGVVGEDVAEAGQALVHVFGSNLICRGRSSIIDVLALVAAVQDEVVVALVQHQDAPGLEHSVVLGQGLAALGVGEQVGEGVAQADEGVEKPWHVLAEPAPVGAHRQGIGPEFLF